MIFCLVLLILQGTLKKNPETALRKANQKFETRFREMEDHLQTSNQKLENLSFQEMDKLWELVKSKA